MSPHGSAERSESPAHRPVLLREVLERLSPSPGETHLDATVGLGGHAVEILRRLGERGLLVGIDRDAEALEIARARLAAAGHPFILFRGVYSQYPEFLRIAGLPREEALDGVLFDLGVSALQLSRPERGFSLLRSGPLDMRMSPGEGAPARDFLARAPVEELERVIREFGEEPQAKRIARAIDRARRERPLETTEELARIVESVVPRRGRRLHPATRTFQGIRIYVNEELEHLRSALRDLDRAVKPGGRVAVLSYHSLEDRIVKESFRDGVRRGFFRWQRPNPCRASPGEVAANPGSRSARLRSVVRV